MKPYTKVRLISDKNVRGTVKATWTDTTSLVEWNKKGPFKGTRQIVSNHRLRILE